ncbi:glycosyltransferase family 4 protein [Thermococcus argininiproducens]|uniref:Glycosyltransferase family 4 protein n=1 Tax=Thermococcus argininiproducens TaxID=2866384 RepID=A0A9E7MAM1_9EURY|nr:glycosyltransferase family 4 protein [Thermococcus argininiproducens]USH00450.1 glycosyltransferase family 4 protein [Thermococcus argininiproducens]
MKVLMMGPLDKAGGVATHTRELTNALDKVGISVEVYSWNAKRGSPKIISYLVKFHKKTLGVAIKLIKDSKNFDIVHIQSSGPIGGFLPALIAASLKRVLGFKLVVTFHYSNTPSFVKRYGSLLRFVIKNSNRFIVVSSKQKKAILDIAKEFKKRIVVIPNGYNPRRIYEIPKDNARKKLGLNHNDKVIVNVALLLEKKGQKYLIDAMNILVNSYKQEDIKCFIIGEGPLKSELQKRINDYQLQNHVKLLGFVPDEELVLWLNAANLFVLSSLTESFGVVVLEALAVSTPVVATVNGGSEEIITSEDYGLLCPSRDPKCLAEKILIALNKEWNREKIRNYVENFTWENIAKKTSEVYLECINEEL